METGVIQSKYRNEKAWDFAGIVIGLLGCLAQLTQVISEWQREDPSGLSIGFVFGYLLVFGFWLAYGVFFRRPAIIVTNAIALILQTFLFVAVF
ncbi:hypothetical protein [Teredinibacter sp. KSP-S5-2]|uniref:hypothetical protein n=1 Tax=Teredinibacter sp. KSP-S5-2 TaxID=3034506 RepID=UPI002934A45F|nr:hypothetical protein [Teredinibacter sp. KSP-S5-2]WNO10004.1 PQ-loop domain-containing transporter [Teredinibacter sp. KSP-S5-2]